MGRAKYINNPLRVISIYTPWELGHTMHHEMRAAAEINAICCSVRCFG